MVKFVDLVISGPDMSGTSTQINDVIEFFALSNYKIRDIRGTEMCALFHAQQFRDYNSSYLHLQDFLSSSIPEDKKLHLLFEINKLLIGGGTNQDLKVASFIKNEVSTYIDPDSAQVWIMEEPTKRGAGQVNRTIEQQRTKYGSELNPLAAAYSHQTYRVDEFLRFRKILREKNKVIVRSRSEESACYQIFDAEYLPQGISKDEYLNLPGHKIAFAHPPTHIFIVCAPEDWSTQQYPELKRQRSAGRLIDDHEEKVNYQLLVNRRYATTWLEKLYEEGTRKYGGRMPEIVRFSIYDSKQEIKRKMISKLKEII